MKASKKAFPYVKLHNVYGRFGKEPGKLQRGRSLAFEQTSKAAVNVYICGIALQICINIIEIISKGNGLFQKKSTPPRRIGFWKFSPEGGQRLWKSRREGGLNLRKSSAEVISTDSSRDSNV